MKKNLNKLATLALTGILMTGMSFGALADTQVEGQTPGSGKVVSFKKKVETDGKTYAPNTTFSFEVNQADEQSGLTIEKYAENESQTVYAYKGIEGGVTAGDAAFTPSEVADSDGTYSKDVSLTWDSSKFEGKEPGVYHYTLKEKDTTYEGVKKDSNTYDLYLVLTRSETTQALECDGIIIAKTDETTKKTTKVDSIVNDYGKTEDTTHDVTITKSVTGALGNKNREFSFKVKVTGAAGEKYYVLKGQETIESNEPENDLTSEKEGLYTLKNGESLHIYGLTEGDQVEVYEQEANTEGYTTKIEYNGDNLTEAQKKMENSVLKGAKVTVVRDDSTIAVTNDKDATTPTGVVMNIAPYAAMVLGAGAFAGVFLGRKKSEDEE